MVQRTHEIPKNGLKADDFALSEIFGYVLLMGIVLAGIVFIVVFATPTVNSTKDNAQFTSVEQAFTTMDSRISKARFSTSIFQETPFQLNGGVVTVDGSDANSWIEIYKRDAAGQTLIHPRVTLGTIKCKIGDREVAYQDGGVWEKYPDGGSVMISPPDFEYNGETLTLPIMSIQGSESVGTGSSSTVLIDSKSLDTGSQYRIYPASAANLQNPVEAGKNIIVWIKTDYPQAWRDFIVERTQGKADIIQDPYDPHGEIVEANLTTGRPLQNGAVITGMDTRLMETDNDYDPVTKFELDLRMRNPGNDYFITLHPEMPADPCLEIEATRNTGGPGKNDLVIVYKYTDTTGGHDIHEVFSRTLNDVFDEGKMGNISLLRTDITLRAGDENGDGDLLDHDDILTPTSTWGSDEYNYDTLGTFAGISDPKDVNPGETKTLRDVTEHYLRLMATHYPTTGPKYEAYGNEKGNSQQKIHYSTTDSTFWLQYDSKQDLKYLYVTHGVIAVNLSSGT